jgi:hypothetical protein
VTARAFIFREVAAEKGPGNWQAAWVELDPLVEGKPWPDFPRLCG